VTVVGSCMTDLISYVPELPKPGETVHGTSFMMGFGGKGANQAVMSAKLGANTAMVAKLGTDSFGDNYMANLKNVGVNVEHVGVVEGSSGVATITVDSNAENVIVLAAGANNHLCEEDVKLAQELISQSAVVVCQMEVPLPTTLAALKTAKGVRIFNAAPATKSLPAELYCLCDIFCVNESEAQTLLGVPVTTLEDAKVAAGMLVERGAGCGMVTLGAQGVIYKQGAEECLHVPCPQVKALDTTGAGDSFIGALAYLMPKTHLTFKEVVERSCQIASLSVTKLGTQSSYPEAKDIECIMSYIK